ncbi:isocitrate lyase/phosphoenolpyruvate mutase family protein [Actinocorallia libanotica]
MRDVPGTMRQKKTGENRFARFKALHHAAEPLLLPNAWDYASAAALEAAGFAAVGTTSLGVAVAAGKPDAQAAALEETIALAGVLARLPCPVTVDLEAGFGDPAETADLAARLAALGIAGVNIEDGRPDGSLSDPERLRATVRAVKERVPDLFVNARTDAFWLSAPHPLEAAITRIRAYAEAGADGVFVPAIVSDEHIAAVVGAVDVPVNVLFLPDHHTVSGLASLGVRRISMGSLLFRAALAAVLRTANAVRTGEEITEKIPGYAEVNDLAAPLESRP